MAMNATGKLSFLSLFALVGAMSIVATPDAHAAKLADGVWSQSGTPGTTTISFTSGEALGVNDTIVLTFPDGEAPIDLTGTDVAVTGQTSPTRANDAVDNSIIVTLSDAITSGTALTVTMTDALDSYTASTYAQQSVAININDVSKYPHDFGLAVITNDNTTDVTATVPLFLTLAVDDVTMDLGTLSVASVKTAQQSYTVNSNNRTGVQLQVTTDGALRDGHGNTIDAVADGAVSAGTEEYGVELSSFTSTIGADAGFTTGDVSLPATATDVVSSTTMVDNGTFDVEYKAGISGLTTAGEYSQTVTFTIATNA